MREPHEARLADAAIAAGVRDDRVLAALSDVPRAEFMPRPHRSEANLDGPIPIGHGQVSTQPSLSALMIEALGLRGNERVLEIGTGSGYQTALLSRLAAFVFSMERLPDLAVGARKNLGRLGFANVEVVIGDGSRGLPAHAPFDAIIVSAAFPEVPPALVEQLAPGGRLVQPIGAGETSEVTLFHKRDSELQRISSVTSALFVPLRVSREET
jgi:protein-L-isoaspartate(D-aspartate) O-methyltransferase